MKLSVYAACGLAALCAICAQAQSTSLDEVVVTAKSLEDELPQQLSQYGTRVDTISAARIQNGGYLDVAGALEALAPGLYISPRNGPFDYVQISLQGSRTTDVLWLVDGIRINNRLYAGTTPLDTLPAGMIDRIEVLNGGQALFYGTQAVAGAINIVTKGFSAHSDGAVSVGYDTNQAQQYNGFYRDSIGSNHFVVYATHNQAPGIEPFPDSEFQPSGTDRRRFYKVTSVGGKYAYDFARGVTVTAAYDHTNANLDFAQPQLTAIAYNQRNDDLVSIKLDYAPSDEFKFYIKDYYHWWYAHYTEFDNVIGTPGGADHDRRPRFLGIQGLRNQSVDADRGQSRLRVSGGLRFPKLLGPRLSARDPAADRTRECVFRPNPHDAGPHPQCAFRRRTALQHPQCRRVRRGLERQRAVRPLERLVCAREFRNRVQTAYGRGTVRE